MNSFGAFSQGSQRFLPFVQKVIMLLFGKHFEDYVIEMTYQWKNDNMISDWKLNIGK